MMTNSNSSHSRIQGADVGIVPSTGYCKFDLVILKRVNINNVPDALLEQPYIPVWYQSSGLEHGECSDGRTAGTSSTVGADESDEEVTLVDRLDAVLNSIESHKTAHELHVTQTEAKFTEMMADVTKLSDGMKDRVSNIESDLLVVKWAFLGHSDGLDNLVNMKVPEPKAFGGARNAKELENFLSDTEQYFLATHVLEGERVTITAMYLTGDAKLWWRTQSKGEVRPKIETWESLKKELREQFLPCNASWVARELLKRLKHTGTNWAQLELRRLGVQDLPLAIAAANGLADFKLTNKSNSSESSSSKSKDKNKKKDEKKAGSKKWDKELPNMQTRANTNRVQSLALVSRSYNGATSSVVCLVVQWNYFTSTMNI
ncbi:hypothetical protein Vadar_010755 [Vaccinium darrowii]|uniref:Uncharacterized protein n=1 Tax=Vaccinium darrowii TaxID=229202 RepID=A0ACB7XGM6_9ERIC|nr:hypothetical protein Vadar_010755 [Vaccinium darrowii]